MDTKAREQAKAKVLAMLAKLSHEALCIAWMTTEAQAVTQELAMTRGWLLDELHERLGDDLFDEWLTTVDENGDALNPLNYFTRTATTAREPLDGCPGPERAHCAYCGSTSVSRPSALLDNGDTYCCGVPVCRGDRGDCVADLDAHEKALTPP